MVQLYSMSENQKVGNVIRLVNLFKNMLPVSSKMLELSWIWFQAFHSAMEYHQCHFLEDGLLSEFSGEELAEPVQYHTFHLCPLPCTIDCTMQRVTPLHPFTSLFLNLPIMKLRPVSFTKWLWKVLYNLDSGFECYISMHKYNQPGLVRVSFMISITLRQGWAYAGDM